LRRIGITPGTDTEKFEAHTLLMPAPEASLSAKKQPMMTFPADRWAILAWFGRECALQSSYKLQAASYNAKNGR